MTISDHKMNNDDQLPQQRSIINVARDFRTASQAGAAPGQEEFVNWTEQLNWKNWTETLGRRALNWTERTVGRPDQEDELNWTNFC